MLSRGDAGAVLARSAGAALDTPLRSAAAGSTVAGIACADRADCADRVDGMSGCTALAWSIDLVESCRTKRTAASAGPATVELDGAASDSIDCSKEAGTIDALTLVVAEPGARINEANLAK